VRRSRRDREREREREREEAGGREKRALSASRAAKHALAYNRNERDKTERHGIGGESVGASVSIDPIHSEYLVL